MAESGKFYNVQLADQSASGKVYKVRDVTGEKNVSGKVYQVKGLGGGDGGSGTTIRNQDKQITANGTYTADVGYTGLGTVNVNVASGSPAQKFGATIDNFLGNVDTNGKLSKPADIEELNLAGVKSIGENSMQYAFAGKEIKRFIANDVESIGNRSFYYCFSNSRIEQASFDGIEEINASYAFNNCFAACASLKYLSFKKLKRISGSTLFGGALSSASAFTLTYNEIFPSLEEIAGDSALNIGRPYKANEVITFSKVKKITGGNSTYSATFGGSYVQNTVWNFPNATEFTGYIWNIGASYPGEIHFSAANQAAIEACEGYDYKWGFAGATIFFDL